jgi:phospholipase/carboxylesterase
LPMVLGQASLNFLTAHGFNIEWHEYPMEHAVSLEEIADIARWLAKVIPAS